MQKFKVAGIVSAIAAVVIAVQFAANSAGSQSGSEPGSAYAGGTIPLAAGTPYAPPAQDPPLTVTRKDGTVARVAPSLPDSADLPRPPIEGSPAIQPQVAPGQQAPTITEASVREYHRTNHTNSAGHFSSSGPSTIERIEFLTAGELAQRAKLAHIVEEMNLSGDTPLCVVQYKGTFHPRPHPDRSAATSEVPATRSYVLEIFNARTGNRLMSSISNELR